MSGFFGDWEANRKILLDRIGALLDASKKNGGTWIAHIEPLCWDNVGQDTLVAGDKVRIFIDISDLSAGTEVHLGEEASTDAEPDHIIEAGR